MNFRSSELTSEKLFPLHRPSGLVGMPERCSPERIRFAALTRVLACSAPFRQISIRNGRLRREHLSNSGARLEKKKYLDSVGLLMEVADNRYPKSFTSASSAFLVNLTRSGLPRIHERRAICFPGTDLRTGQQGLKKEKLFAADSTLQAARRSVPASFAK
jgi:hypothetical protein